MKNVLLVLLFTGAALAQLPCSNTSAACYTGQVSVTFGGLTRYYEAYVPKAPLAAKPPMVVYLGPAAPLVGWNTPPLLPANSCPTCQSNSLALHTFADADKVVILWPSPVCSDNSSLPTSVCTSSTTTTNGSWYWNINYFDTSFAVTTNDSGFIHSLVTLAAGTWGVDSSRIFGMGYSTGAFMMHRYALDEPGDLAGIYSKEGQLWAQQSTTCTGSGASLSCPSSPSFTSTPIAVYIANGDADTTIITSGGNFNWKNWSPSPQSAYPDADRGFNYWNTGECGSGVVTTSGGTNTNIIVANLTSIVGNGTTATATCSATCGANPTGQYVISGNSVAGFNHVVITVATDSGTGFTFPSTVNSTGSNGTLQLTYKYVTGCTNGLQVQYNNMLNGGHTSPTSTQLETAFSFLDQFPFNPTAFIGTTLSPKVKLSSKVGIQ